MTTFNEDNYLYHIIVHRNGKVDVEEPFSYEKWRKKLDEDLEIIKTLLGASESDEETKAMIDRDIQNIKDTKEFLDAIWNYEEDNE